MSRSAFLACSSVVLKTHRLASSSATCSLSSYANRGTSNFKIFIIKAACSASSSTRLSDSSLAHLSASSSCPPLYTIQLFRNLIGLNREYLGFCYCKEL